MTPTFPAADCRRSHWRSFIMAAMTWLSDVGDGDVKFNDIIAHIENLPGFPGWHVWGDYNGKPNQMGRRYISLEAGAMKKEGLISSPRRGTFRLAVEGEIGPVVEPSVVHKAVLTVVPDPDPEITAPEPVEAPVADGPTTHPLYLSSERARKTAIAQTRCFGFYSERAPTCGDCPLAGLCFAARGANIAEANARAVELAEAKAKRKVWVEAAASLSGEMDAAADDIGSVLDEAAESAPESEAPIMGTPVTLPWAIICSACGGSTEPGVEIITVDGQGSFHKGCAPRA